MTATLCDPRRHGSNRHKVVSAEDASYLIQSGATVCVAGFVTQNCAEEVLAAVGKRYETTKEPKGLTLLFSGGPGDYGLRGLNHFRHEGMLKRTIGAHYGQVPSLGQMALDGKIEAYLLPMGSTSRMIRAAAQKGPGHITKVGFGTLVDPANGGGKVNSKTTEDIVTVVEILGEKYLCYRAIPVDVAIIRGTTADACGNITMERESLLGDNLVTAMAARANGGIVIAQVERLASRGSLPSRQVRIPGTLVDAVVVASDPKNHQMSFVTPYHPGYSGEVRQPAKLATFANLDDRKIIARRAALELLPNDVVNLGIGMPEGVAMVADEEHVLSQMTLTTEPGVHGGVGASGHDFGPAENYDALIELNQQFDFYNGGGLNVCYLGMAECTARGDINVTRVGKKLTGPGGFIDISQSTKRVNFLGTFTAGGLEVDVDTDKKELKIVTEGRIKKFVATIPEITFNGSVALERKQQVKYITERAVFELTPNGIELVEVAPGIDVQRQVLDLMEFKPLVRLDPSTNDVRRMNANIFGVAIMGIRQSIFSPVTGRDRVTYDAATNTLSINLHNLTIMTVKDLEVHCAIVEDVCKPLGRRVNVVVNYDGFDIRGELLAAWKAYVKRLKDAYYTDNVRRFCGKTFYRHQLIAALGITREDSPK